MTLTDLFYQLCPTYLVYGMTWDEYWHGDPWMAKAYREAYLMKRKIQNENMWIQGAYISDAFGITLSNAFGKGRKLKYMEKPLDIFPKTEAEKEEELREKKMRLIQHLNKLKTIFGTKGKET